MPRPSLLRKLLYSVIVSGAVLGLATIALNLLDTWGWIESYNQDDSVLYLQGKYLKVDSSQQKYQIMDGQGSRVVQASFPTHKKRGVIRIFVTGESFVRGGHQLPMGTPPVGYGTITDWMQQLLETRYPSQRFEVINAGANGQNSFRIAAVVSELVQAEPDILVVAMGNNEGTGPTAYSEELNNWVLYRVLKQVVRTPPTERPATSQPPTLTPTETERAFRDNLSTILKAAAAHQVTVVLGTLPINLPNISGFLPVSERATITTDPDCAQVETLARNGRCDEALSAIEACGNTFFGLIQSADCMQAQSDYQRAAQLYEAAIELDPRSRTRPSFNNILREAAQENKLPLADLANAMTTRSPNHLSGAIDFIDHVHLTCMGYLPMARTIVESLVLAGLIPKTPGPDPSTRSLLERYPWDTRKSPPAVSPTWARQVCSPDPNFNG